MRTFLLWTGGCAAVAGVILTGFIVGRLTAPEPSQIQRSVEAPKPRALPMTTMRQADQPAAEDSRRSAVIEPAQPPLEEAMREQASLELPDGSLLSTEPLDEAQVRGMIASLLSLNEHDKLSRIIEAIALLPDEDRQRELVAELENRIERLNALENPSEEQGFRQPREAPGLQAGEPPTEPRPSYGELRHRIEALTADRELTEEQFQGLNETLSGIALLGDAREQEELTRLLDERLSLLRR